MHVVRILTSLIIVFVLHDQLPIFTIYDFSTGKKVAKLYKLENKVNTKSVILQRYAKNF
jgi:hypothetical protein